MNLERSESPFFAAEHAFDNRAIRPGYSVRLRCHFLKASHPGARLDECAGSACVNGSRPVAGMFFWMP